MKQTKTAKPAPAPETPAIDWSQYGQNAGFEKVSTEDLGIPFLMIIQKGSPEFDKTHPAHANKKVTGVGPGDIINTVTRRILYKSDGEPLIFVPCGYERLYVEWKPRDSGGGFVRQHVNPAILSECKRNEKNQDVLPNGNLVVTTAYFFGLAEVDDNHEKCVIGMTSTQLKKSRMWLNLMMQLKVTTPDGRSFTPPMFSHKYALTTIPESNQNGSWFGWSIETAGMISNQLLLTTASEISKTIAKGARPQLGPPPTTDEELPM